MIPHENGINTARSRNEKLRSDHFAVSATREYSMKNAMKYSMASIYARHAWRADAE